MIWGYIPLFLETPIGIYHASGAIYLVIVYDSKTFQISGHFEMLKIGLWAELAGTAHPPESNFHNSKGCEVLATHKLLANSYPTLPETKSSPLKIVHRKKEISIFQPSNFSGAFAVHIREGRPEGFETWIPIFLNCFVGR